MKQQACHIEGFNAELHLCCCHIHEVPRQEPMPLQEAGLSSGRIGASGEGFPAAAGDRDLLDGTGGLEKAGPSA